VDQLHEEPNEAHDGEANSRSNGYLLKLFPNKLETKLKIYK
jgi:hypothetical protein